MTPRVTVLMPVYNGAKYLKEAIDSILSQSYADFEFLIINDGSTDHSLEIIKSYSDNRIHLINNDENIGVARSLNKGIQLARGEFIVRMDADDISLPNRIMRQVEYMDKNLGIGISGTWLKHIIQNDIDNLIWKFQTDPNMIRFLLLFYNPMGHNTVILRKKFFISNKLFYRPSYETAEDYDLWVRASFFFPITNIPEVLVLYRRHYEQVGFKNKNKQDYVCDLIINNQLKLFKIDPVEEDLRIHSLIGHNKIFNSKTDIQKAKAWLEKLYNANRDEKIFPDSAFLDFLTNRWFQVCSNDMRIGIWHFRTYYSSELIRLSQINFIIFFKFIIKYLIKCIRCKL